MQRQSIALIKLHQMGIIYIKLGILGISYIKQCTLSLAVHLETECLGNTAQQIARTLYIHSHGIYAIAITQTETHLHDKQVFVIVAEDGISVFCIIKIVSLECL